MTVSLTVIREAVLGVSNGSIPGNIVIPSLNFASIRQSSALANISNTVSIVLRPSVHFEPGSTFTLAGFGAIWEYIDSCYSYELPPQSDAISTTPTLSTSEPTSTTPELLQFFSSTAENLLLSSSSSATAESGTSALQQEAQTSRAEEPPLTTTPVYQGGEEVTTSLMTGYTSSYMMQQETQTSSAEQQAVTTVPVASSTYQGGVADTTPVMTEEGYTTTSLLQQNIESTFASPTSALFAFTSSVTPISVESTETRFSSTAELVQSSSSSTPTESSSTPSPEMASSSSSTPAEEVSSSSSTPAETGFSSTPSPAIHSSSSSTPIQSSSSSTPLFVFETSTDWTTPAPSGRRLLTSGTVNDQNIISSTPAQCQQKLIQFVSSPSNLSTSMSEAAFGSRGLVLRNGELLLVADSSFNLPEATLAFEITNPVVERAPSNFFVQGKLVVNGNLYSVAKQE
eukprot:765595-Hanusia_phi.AAC.1